ncbi:hypothetical protein [Hyphococcus sp.]|uniref:hypothetical protein n=1 Tax=Hyphococcus sp. TaxID=2038636 RepID=UPI003750B7BA
MSAERELRVHAQIALLGAITPGLRAVSVELRENTLGWRCVFESEAAREAEWEELSAAATEVIAHYPEVAESRDEFLVCSDLSLTEENARSLEFLVFRRFEGE